MHPDGFDVDPHHYMVFHGLMAYSCMDVARELADKSFDLHQGLVPLVC
ncbi:MAG: hypothetical protein J7M39_05045 [Anaerolineae bacterium]|nr:hypothetical protein [Anaerolineae bacterium]